MISICYLQSERPCPTNVQYTGMHERGRGWTSSRSRKSAQDDKWSFCLTAGQPADHWHVTMRPSRCARPVRPARETGASMFSERCVLAEL